MPGRPIQAEDLLRLKFVSDVQIHPGGDFGICCVKSVRAAGKYRTNLYRVQPGKEPEQWTFTEGSDHHPRWSPDGSTLAFFSTRSKPGVQIYVLGAEGGEARQLTTMPEGAWDKFKWSPDGKQIAATFRPEATDWTEAEVDKRKKAEASDPPQEVTCWPYRLDGDGYFIDQRHRLYIIDAGTGEHREVVGETDLGEFDFDWHPDSERLVVSYRVGRETFLDPPGEDLFWVDASSGMQRPIPWVPGSKRALCFSPSGRYLAFIFDDRSEVKWGMLREQVGILDFETGKEWSLAKDEATFIDGYPAGDCRDAAAHRLFWTADESSLVFQYAIHGTQHVAALGLDGGAIRILNPEFRGEVHLGSQAGGRYGAWICTPSRVAEPVFIEVRRKLKVDPAGEFNADLFREVEVHLPEEFWLDTPGGSRLQCWSISPQPRSKKSPVAIEVHGGPMGQYMCSLFFEMQLLAAQGFAVFFSNPRGSTGYGESYCNCIQGAWGQKDWDDVRTLTDYVQGLEWVDKKCVCVLGGSYGGFMVNWAISHSRAYARAITDRCVSNLLSKWGNSDYIFVPDAWWPGVVYGDTEVLWECSPIKHFASVTTPTLIIHSEGDLRCNIEQGEQVYAALKMLGVETKFIRYPRSTSHGMSRGGPPDLRVHRLKAIVDWLSRA